MPDTWLQFKNRVKELMTDIVPDDDNFVRAVAEYVKYKISREANHDLNEANSFLQTFTFQRNRLVGFKTTLNSSDLRTAVNPLITVDANRLGNISEPGGFVDKCIAEAKADIEGFSTRIDSLIRQGVIDIQHHVPMYRNGHETIYESTDVLEDGSASRGELPDQCIVHSAHFIKECDEGCKKVPLSNYDWNRRFSLTRGTQALNAGHGFIAIDPQCSTFYVYPKIEDDIKLLVTWTGTKLDFADGDTVPFDEPMAFAVAEYVKAFIGPRNELQTYFHPTAGTYTRLRRNLILESRDRRQMRNA